MVPEFWVRIYGNPAIPDATILDQITKECPAGPYSSVWVCSTTHQFGLEKREERSRLIQFTPTYYESAWNMLYLIFQRTTIEPLDISRASDGLLGSPNPRDRHFAHSAYWQNYTIKIHISMESIAFDINAKQGTGTEIALRSTVGY